MRLQIQINMFCVHKKQSETMGGKTVLEGKDHNRITQDVKQKTRQPKFGEGKNHEKQGVKRRKRIGTLCVSHENGKLQEVDHPVRGMRQANQLTMGGKKGQYLCVPDGGSMWLSALWRSGEATESERREWQGLESKYTLFLAVPCLCIGSVRRGRTGTTTANDTPTKETFYF